MAVASLPDESLSPSQLSQIIKSDLVMKETFGPRPVVMSDASLFQIGDSLATCAPFWHDDAVRADLIGSIIQSVRGETLRAGAPAGWCG